MTRLNRIHPYPGMIADSLAVALAKVYIRRGDRVLDPFCGTGRILLAAAQQGATAIGVDTNPLAGVIVKAKAARCNLKVLDEVVQDLERSALHRWRGFEYDLEEGRKVPWFSAKARRELSALIWFINQRAFRSQELHLLAGVLSATAREVSYCRSNQWKIHRMPPTERSAFKKSACTVFLSRLKHALNELRRSETLPGSCRAFDGDSRHLRDVLRENSESKRFDLVFSSPPYGDSRTTVQYGGVSSLCLGVLRHLPGLKVNYNGMECIDSCCLGGRLRSSGMSKWAAENGVAGIWSSGDKSNAGKRVFSFLVDLQECCQEIVSVMKRRGTAIFVVARRTVAGSHLKLDRYLINVMGELGCACDKVIKRRIAGKLTPYVIHARGRSLSCRDDERWRVATMRQEYVLVFKKAPRIVR